MTSIAGTTPDATTSTKGKILLAQDLGGTADLPRLKTLTAKGDILTHDGTNALRMAAGEDFSVPQWKASATNGVQALGAWVTYTPTVTQSVNVTVTASYCKYVRVGRFCNIQFYLSVTGAGTASNRVTISLPFTAVQASMGGGVGYIYDASVTTAYGGITEDDSVTTLAFRSLSALTNYLGSVTFTAGLASGDILTGNYSYETT